MTSKMLFGLMKLQYSLKVTKVFVAERMEYVHDINLVLNTLKVHVWAGISWEGPTPVCIFEGIMNAKLYIEILEGCYGP